MFSQACVKNSVYKGEACALPGMACMARGGVWLGECMARGERVAGGVCVAGGVHGGGAWLWACVFRAMEGKNGHCSGQCASYWNAFLFEKCDQWRI